MQWSINRGFKEYLAQMEEIKLNLMSQSLESAYRENGNWDFLRDEPLTWYQRLREALRSDEVSEKATQLTDKNGQERPIFPFVVLDEKRNPVFGTLPKETDIKFKPIIHNDKTVGYIALFPPKHFLHPRQEEFLKGQTSTLIFAVAGMLIVVIIFSFPLANHYFIKPIKKIADATHDLASGKYNVRIEVSTSDELGQLARDFKSMAMALERNEKSRRQWVADISHELRTPLAILRGEIEALLEGVRPITPEAIRSLNSEVLRLNRLVDDLYQLALSDAGEMKYQKEELRLGEFLIDVVELYQEEFIYRGIKLSMDISKDSNVIVFADPKRLQQLFGNLLDNSMKYTEHGGQLVVRLYKEVNQAVIEFEDSAPGVSDRDLNRLFERLYRVETSRSRATGGAGLGLAICKNIVEAHEGRIMALPSILGGLLIRVYLPIWGQPK